MDLQKCISCLMLLAITGMVQGISTCPSDDYIESRIEASEIVQSTVQNVFSKLLNDSAIANDSLSSMGVYEHIATSVGVSVSPAGFVQFQEAVSEVTVAKLVACSTFDKEAIKADVVSNLTREFILLTDAKNSSQARVVYGKLLCLQELLSDSDSTRKKRQEDPMDLLEEFFDSLDGVQLATIFGVGDIFFGPESDPPTLAFVVDDTGSMSGEIRSVQKLIRSFIKTERSEPFAYILTTFNDPEVGVPQKYSARHVAELKALEQAVNALKAHDGGDCPERGMTGILNALSLANPDSNVIVLTDASPKDVAKKDEVIAKATELQNSIHFFLSRTGCGDFTPYREVANKTFGIVVNRIVDFEAFAEFADKVGRFKLGDDGRKRKRQVTENCITFTTSFFTRSINVLLSSVSSGSEITITTPIGSIDKITPSGSIVTYNEDPVAGMYKVCSTGTFEYALSTTSDLDFFVEYVYIEVNTSRTSLPHPGTPVNVVVSSSRINEISTEQVYLDLLLQDEIVSSVALTRCGNLLAGVLIVPNVPFQYQLRGHDSEGNSFTNIRKAVITPKDKMCTLPAPSPSMTVTTSTSITTSSINTSSTSPTSVFLECPCLNGGRCVTIERFGRKRVFCSCAKGFTGSRCQSKLSS